MLKWYCDQKNTSIFSSDFETLVTKQSPREVLGLNFKKTVYLNYNLRFNNLPLLYQKRYNDVIYLRAVCEHSLLIMQNMPYGLFSMQHGSFELSDSQTRVLHN